MQIDEVFKFFDYRKYLLALLRNNKDERGFQTRLAEAAGCQRSFFSQMLQGKANLSLDQGIALAKHLQLKPLEISYFLDLINFDRAGSSPLKTFYHSRLSLMRQEREDLSQRFKVNTGMDAEQEKIYYSAWYWAAIHILVGIDGFQNVTSIAKKLSLPTELVEQVLKGLSDLGLALKSGTHWFSTNKAVHLPKHTVFSGFHHAMWRQQANLSMQRRHEDSIHYSSVQAISKSDYSKIKSTIMEMLDVSRKQILQSGSEELTCLLCDFFVI